MRGKKSRKKKRTKKKSARRRNGEKRVADLVAFGVLLLAAYFAIFGGEFTILELKRLETLELAQSAQLARVRAEIDSLGRVAERLRTDPAAIERVARERFGMIRDGEILYRFREPAPTEEGEIDGPDVPE